MLNLNINKCTNDILKSDEEIDLLQDLNDINIDICVLDHQISDLTKLQNNIDSIRNTVSKYGWNECLEYLFGDQINENQLNPAYESIIQKIVNKITQKIKKTLNAIVIRIKILNSNHSKTMELLERFKQKIHGSSTEAIGLSNRFKIGISHDFLYDDEDKNGFTKTEIELYAKYCKKEITYKKMVEMMRQMHHTCMLDLNSINSLERDVRDLVNNPPNDSVISSLNRNKQKYELVLKNKSAIPGIMWNIKNDTDNIHFMTAQELNKMSNTEFSTYVERYLSILNSIRLSINKFENSKSSQCELIQNAINTCLTLCEASYKHIQTELKFRTNNL